MWLEIFGHFVGRLVAVPGLVRGSVAQNINTVACRTCNRVLQYKIYYVSIFICNLISNEMLPYKMYYVSNIICIFYENMLKRFPSITGG